MSVSWANLYRAAKNNEKNKVEYQLTLLKNWIDTTKFGSVKIGNYTLTQLMPIYAAVMSPTVQSGSIAYYIAQEAYKQSLAKQKPLIHKNTMAAAYKLLISGNDRGMVRKLVRLALSEGTLGNSDAIQILQQFFNLRDKYVYTVAYIVFEVISHSTQNLKDIITILVNKSTHSTPIEILTYIVRIWTIFGNGPSPAQLRKIYKYDTHMWNENQLEAIIRILQEYGYDFNNTYISQTSNEPVSLLFFNAAKTNKIIKNILIELILSGRIDVNEKTKMAAEQSANDVYDAFIAWEHVSKHKLEQLCSKTSIEFMKQRATNYKLERIAYQFQLIDMEKRNICNCIENMFTAYKSGIFPFKEIRKVREDKYKCDNEYSLDMVNINDMSDDQLLQYVDKTMWKRNKQHPVYCFDKGSANKLLTGVNPYTGTEFTEDFMSQVMDSRQNSNAPALGLEETLGAISKDGKLPTYTLDDFHRIFSRFKNLFNNINPYLDYEAWATQYNVDDYNKEILSLALPSFVASLELNVVDILLPREEYVTKLMAIILNRLETCALNAQIVITGISNMLEYIPFSDMKSVTTDDELYAGWSIEALTDKKIELMEKFMAGKMLDQSLMTEIQQIRQILLERSGE